MKKEKKFRASRHTKTKSPWAWMLMAFLTFYIITVMSMYLWGFFAALKTNLQFSKDVLGLPPGWPWEWAWGNFPYAINAIKVNVVIPGYRGYVYFDTMLWNSIFWTIGGAFINTFCTWLVAYLITRFWHYKFSKFLFTANVILMTIPIIGNTASALRTFKFLGFYNNYLFFIVNNIGFVGSWLLYLNAYIRGLGMEYYEAAYMDGAGNLTCMFKIAFPLTSQMFWVIFLTGAIGRWNDYTTNVMWAPDYPTLAYGIFKASMSNATELSFPPLQIAICVVLMVPMLLLFVCFQDVLMGNLKIGGVKG